MQKDILYDLEFKLKVLLEVESIILILVRKEYDSYMQPLLVGLIAADRE